MDDHRPLGHGRTPDMKVMGKKGGGKAGRRSPLSYQRRDYRSLVIAGDLRSSYAQVEETDLHILADGDVTDCAKLLVQRYRLQIEGYIRSHPQFAVSLVPLPLDPLAPSIVREMLAAGEMAGVGPMAAVAGAIAEYVGRDLLRQKTREVIVENGGDIFLQREVASTVAIFAGPSPLSNTMGIRLSRQKMPCSVCTSSGTVGHSLSFGDADSVTVYATNAALADAAATRLGNEVGKGTSGDLGIKRALALAQEIAGIGGVVVIRNELFGAVGDIELVGL